jgi:hypothetical protein
MSGNDCLALVSTVKGYEMDSFAELWYFGLKLGPEVELLEIPSEGRLLCKVKGIPMHGFGLKGILTLLPGRHQIP